MNSDDAKVAVGSGTSGMAGAVQGGTDRGRNVWPWINWALALATLPAAAIVMLFALGAVMSTDGCSGSCPNLGRGGIDFGVAFYGAPVVALVVIAMSFVTAKHRSGIVVPLCGWLLLIVDVALMALSVSG